MSLILVVDDDLNTAESMADMLSLLGYKTSVALSPRTALEAVQRHPPALILLDLNMPGVTGLEVCRYIKRDPAAHATPVIFISAEDDPSVMEAAKQAGAIGYLVKPVELDALETVLQNTLEAGSNSQGKNPQGKSPQGKNPQGKSPQNKSPQGKSPQNKSPQDKNAQDKLGKT